MIKLTIEAVDLDILDCSPLLIRTRSDKKDVF